MLVEVYKDVEACILRGYMVSQMAYMIRGLRELGKRKMLCNSIKTI